MEVNDQKKEIFLNTIREWQADEAVTSERVDELMKKVKSPLISATLDIMKQDSIRHKALLQIIIDNIEDNKDAVDLKELAELSGTLKEHVSNESRMIHIASKTYESSQKHIVEYITSFILADEKKHHEMLNQLLSLAEIKTTQK